MIYVGDARKGLELRFGGGGGGREMEETELEEGEACSYRNDNEEYDPSIDPDVTLSYIVRIFTCFFASYKFLIYFFLFYVLFWRY
jgi:hypothetical protein